MLAVAAAAVTAMPGQAGARTLDDCRPLRALFYASSGSLGLAQALAANASPCAQYYVSVPPLTADKTQMRSGTAGPIRALGANIHALAEVNVTAWQGWVTSTGSSWYQAGVEARRRMAAAGFDVAAGDTWAVNELSSAVRVGSGTSRQDMRDLVHGLYDGDGGPPAKGVVFVTGIGQPTASLDTYKARLESWLQDAAFWGDMSAYVSDYLQEAYGDVRDYAVPGADVPTRLGYLNAYLEHVLQLARAGPGTAAPAAGYLATSYAALANAAWAWTSGFGFTAVSSDVMQDYVSAQVAAMRAYDASLGWSADRIGFAWDPSNSLGLSTADFNAQLAAIQARLAAALAAGRRLRPAVVHGLGGRRRIHARLGRVRNLDSDDGRVRLRAADRDGRNPERCDERPAPDRPDRNVAPIRHHGHAVVQLAGRLVLHLPIGAVVADAGADRAGRCRERGLLHARLAAGNPDGHGVPRRCRHDTGGGRQRSGAAARPRERRQRGHLRSRRCPGRGRSGADRQRQREPDARLGIRRPDDGSRPWRRPVGRRDRPGSPPRMRTAR